MSTVILRGGVEVENPLELAFEFLAAYSKYEAGGSSGPASFDESDLRLANRGGARMSAAEIAAILERRGEIEGALRYLKITQTTCHPNVIGPGETYVETPGVPVIAVADKAAKWMSTLILPNSAPGDPDRVAATDPCS